MTETPCPTVLKYQRSSYTSNAIVFDADLTRISHRIKRIGAPNQRKLFCENDFLMIRGEPRCRQSVSRICLDLKPLKAAK